MQPKKMVVAFVGGVVPDTREFDVPGYARAGNLAQIGFLDALHSAGFVIDVVLSNQPIAHYPKTRTIFKGARTVELFSGVSVKLVPLINLLVVRDISRALYIYGYLFFWSMRHMLKDRVIMTYNLNIPPVMPLLLLSRLTGSRLVSILYDVAWPEGYSVGWLRTAAYKTLIRLAENCIPKLDGRIVITDGIARRFAAGRHFIRVDGGVTDLVEQRLFALEPARNKGKLVLLFAGGLNDWNHVTLLIDAMRLCDSDHVELWLAGDGTRISDVRAAAAKDPRIVYHGVLNLDQLFEVYKKADVLLNLRNTIDPAMQYHFPSKLLEILAVGKPVITTSIAHIEEEYGPYCFVLHEETPQGFVRLLNTVCSLSEDERLEIGKRARAFILREHTWKRQGARIRQYLEHDVLKHMVP